MFIFIPPNVERSSKYAITQAFDFRTIGGNELSFNAGLINNNIELLISFCLEVSFNSSNIKVDLIRLKNAIIELSFYRSSANFDSERSSNFGTSNSFILISFCLS